MELVVVDVARMMHLRVELHEQLIIPSGSGVKYSRDCAEITKPPTVTVTLLPGKLHYIDPH